MNIRHVGLIAYYEIKTLSRVWSFKMVAALSVLIVTFLHVITQSSLIEPEWIAISLPSAIPYANAYLVISIQMIIIIFFAGNFSRESRFERANSALSVRPHSNMELLWGKTTGFLILMFGMALFQGAIAIFIHLFGSDSPFALYPYVFYFFTLTCPALFFFTGLTIYVKGIARNPALTYILLLSLLYLFLNLGVEFLYGIFDVLAVAIPNTFSDITGFAELSTYLLQRSCFLAWGGGLILLSISFIHRLPSGTKSNFTLGRKGIWLLALGCVLSGCYTVKFIQRDRERQAIRKVFTKYQTTPKVSITDHNIEFKQEGYTYSASGKLNLININDQKIDSVILYLNPGLEVLKLTSDGKTLSFQREQQILILSLPIEPGETRRIEMEYKGSISPAVCYPEVVDIDSLAMLSRYYLYNMGQNYYYLQPDYTLLTPECLWYPTSKPTVNVNSPYLSDQDYTRFTLQVKGETRRVVIAQGEETKEGENSCFVNKVALPGLTLCIGNYTRKSSQMNGVLYEIFLSKGHEYLIPEEITSEEAIEYWERVCRFRSKDNKVSYAFTKLNLVEIPVHFCAYGRDWKNNSEQVQPEIVLRPEREALYPQAFKMGNEWNGSNNPIQEFLGSYIVEYLTYNIRYTLSGNMFFNRLTGKSWRRGENEVKNESDISLLREKYHYNVYSPEFAGINLLFHVMQEGFNTNFQNWGGSYLTARYLMNRSLQEILQAPEDEIIPRNAIFFKGCNFFKYILCTVSPEKLERFNSDFIQNHAFQSFSYETYCEELEKQLGVSLLDLTRELYSKRGLPAFYFRDARVDDVETAGGKTGYVFSIKAWNKGSQGGILSIQHMYVMSEEQHFYIPAGTCKEIKVYFEGPSDQWTIGVLTNASLNNPSYYTFEPFSEKGRVKEPVNGIFDADTLAFAPEPEVYIVDNDDPGCRIIENSSTFQKLRQRKGYKNTRWHWGSDQETYGELSKSYLEKESGKGDSDIEWEVNLPEPGTYELFVYNNKPLADMRNKISFYRRVKKKSKGPVQRYRFIHANGEENMEIALLDEENGWVSLGIYQFQAGKTKITLSGKGIDQYQYMYADAVKWVKVK